MNTKEKQENLKQAFEDVIWMAIRYADGRHTYAPGMVRDAIKKFKSVYPEWKPRHDVSINKPESISGIEIESDYLYDLFD